jgi:PAS domain S-box-containing protein
MGSGGAVMVIGDITERIRAKEALEASEARLSSTIENLPFDFFSIDADGRYDHQNATCRRHWGELVGKRPEDMAATAEIRQVWMDNNRRALSGETVEGEVEYAFDGKKGYYYNIVAPIRQDDHISGVLGVNIDITERKRAEEASRESEAKFKALVEESLVGVYLIQDQRVQYVNPKVEQIIGYSSEELIGRRLPDELIHPDDKAMVADNIRKRIDGETQSIHYNFRCIAHDGSTKHIEVFGTRTMYDGESAIIGTMIDVTERTKEEEQRQRMRATLDRAEKMEAVGILAGGVAHELNNILGPVVAYPEIISKKLPADSPVKRQVDLIGKSAREAANIIKDLITLARRDHYEMVSTDFNNVVGTYLDSPECEKLMVKNRRVIVEQHLDKQLPAISGCPTHLVKVVMNLIRDAVSAMPEGGKVTITTTVRQLTQLLSGYDKIEPGEYVILTVSDTGAEIPEEDIKRIFEPYFTRNKNVERHSGLNLAVVYGIIKDHKGYYDVFSSAETGTDFVIYLPAAPVADRTAGSLGDDLSGRESILIVDDSEDLCEIAREILQSQGYRVAVAKSGRHAVEHLTHNSVDLLVLDMIMEEDFDGLDTYREIVKLHPNQKAIVVSAYSANERVQQLQHLGVGQYVKKPYSADTLARAVRNELDQHKVCNPT